MKACKGETAMYSTSHDQAILARLVEQNQQMALRINKSLATLKRIKKNAHKGVK